MGTGFTIELPYDQLLLLVMGLFMFVGATRGWYRELITSCVLVALTAILIKPSLAAPIIDYLARFVRLVLAFIQGRGSVDPNKLLARYGNIEVPFDGKNPYLLLIFVLVIFVFLSYSTRGDSKGVTAVSRILGGLLGLFNGYLMVSLFKEYVVKYIQQRSPMLAAAGSPPAFSVAVKGMPAGELLKGQGWQIVAVLALLMVAVLFFSTVSGQPIGKK